MDCPFREAPGYCMEQARIRCLVEAPEAAIGEWRFQGNETLDSRYETGLVQVFLGGSWAFLSHVDELDRAVTTLACQEMGFAAAGFQHFGANLEASSRTVYAACDDVNFGDCRFTDVLSNADDWDWFQSGTRIACLRSAEIGKPGDLRFMSSSVKYDDDDYMFYYYDDPFIPGGEDSQNATDSDFVEGVLQMYVGDNFSGEWRTLCTDNFGLVEAKVACRQLGHFGGVYGSRYAYGPSYVPQWNVGCTGEETALIDCLPKNQFMCNNNYLTTLRCFMEPLEYEQGELRLVGGPDSDTGNIVSGRLEVFRNGVWGTICDDGFGQSDAAVACAEMGYSRRGTDS